uniref:Uncharacterized protein n=1 Tax=Ditylenchus dipsaci TaxID=166011 RepID=A0A915CUQ3_9BILA
MDRREDSSDISDSNPEKRIFQVVPDNNVSILWQIPQIAVITAAEILFSITGFEFAYSQSPASMKSLVQALWILTVAAGDLIIVAVTLINFGNPVLQYLVYAGAMLVIITIFGVLSHYYYEYKIYSDEQESVSVESDQEDSSSDSTSSTQSKLSVVLTSNYGSIKTTSDKPANGLDNIAFIADDVRNTNC